VGRGRGFVAAGRAHPGVLRTRKRGEYGELFADMAGEREAMQDRRARAGARTTVLLLADTHGAVDPRIAALAHACDAVVHAGDIGDAAVLTALGPAYRVLAVRGNNDTPAKWPAKERRRLARLPVQARLELPGGTLVVVHGDRVTPAGRRHEKLRRLHPDARAVVYGHTHRVVCDRRALPWVLNPGAAGRTRTFGGPSCLILEATVGEWRLRLHRFARS
jgi:putative phosphoesterase